MEEIKKDLGGRPRTYDTPEEIQIEIDRYFETIGTFPLKDEYGDIVKNEYGQTVYKEKPPTVSGLALFLGFSDRHSLYDYKNSQKFTHTIKEAISKIEQYAECKLMEGGKPTGAIFWLKNHGWYDKKEVEHSGNIGHDRDLSKLTDEELKIMSAIEQKLEKND